MGVDDVELPVTLTVVYDNVTHTVEPGSRLTFGRSRVADITLGVLAKGRPDKRVPRDCGYFEAEASVWRLYATNSLLLVNDFLGNRTTVFRGTFWDVNRARTAVVIQGAKPWVLEVAYPQWALPLAVSSTPRYFDEAETERPRRVNLTGHQELAMLAVLEPFSQGKPEGASFTAAARRLGECWNARRVLGAYSEAVRKYSEAGIPGLTRDTDLQEASAKRTLFQSLLDQGYLTLKDFEKLDGEAPPQA